LRDHFRRERAELPSLPDLALKIGRAIDDPNNANEDIARLIQLDPSLTARLISVVNSAAFGGFNKITSINQATARLGRTKVRSLVYSCLLKNIFKASSNLLKRRMETVWQHSVHVAALSFVRGRETSGIDSEQALLAGLVHDIGAVAAIGGISRFPVLAEREAVLDHVIETLRVEVGLQTLKHWGLHSEFADVVRDAENWHRIGWAIPQNADVVILAQLHAMVGSARRSMLPRIDAVPAFSKLARGELTPKHSLALLEEAEADVREVRALIGSG
jgi:HD-like signal output (HDOD) protein